MFQIDRTVEQKAEAERIEDILKAKAVVEFKYVARLLASKSNRELLGKTEFQVRDAENWLGTAGIDAALEERNRRDSFATVRTGGAEVPAGSARSAVTTPASTRTDAAASGTGRVVVPHAQAPGGPQSVFARVCRSVMFPARRLGSAGMPVGMNRTSSAAGC